MPIHSPEKADLFEKMLAQNEIIFRICLGFGKDYAAAEELMQEVYLKAYQKIDSLRDNSSAREWLFKIARNTCFDHYKKRPLVTILPLQSVSEPADPKTPESEVLLNEQICRLKKAIRELPKKLKEIFVLREYGHLSYQEIAATLGIKEGTVMSRLNRARRAIVGKIRETAYEKSSR